MDCSCCCLHGLQKTGRSYTKLPALCICRKSFKLDAGLYRGACNCNSCNPLHTDSDYSYSCIYLQICKNKKFLDIFINTAHFVYKLLFIRIKIILSFTVFISKPVFFRNNRTAEKTDLTPSSRKIDSINRKRQPRQFQRKILHYFKPLFKRHSEMRSPCGKISLKKVVGFYSCRNKIMKQFFKNSLIIIIPRKRTV